MLTLTNTKVVGGFILSAIALLAAAIVLFGGAALFRPTERAVVYFQGSVSGLSVGAPVAFRGVRVGSVKDIILEMNAKTGAATMPVYLEFEPSKVNWIGGTTLTAKGWQAQIEHGLRAQLATQSLITGQLMVQLDYFPGTPATTVGHDTSVREIPAVQSQIEQLTRAVSSLPLRDIADRALGVLSSLEDLLRSQSMASLASSLAQVDALLTADRPRLDKTLAQADATPRGRADDGERGHRHHRRAHARSQGRGTAPRPTPL
jgi:paraquat-inducible protein B